MELSTRDMPIVSFAIPCRNEKDCTEALIRSILAQEPPPGGFGVILADGMSDDGTQEILRCVARSEAGLS